MLPEKLEIQENWFTVSSSLSWLSHALARTGYAFESSRSGYLPELFISQLGDKNGVLIINEGFGWTVWVFAKGRISVQLFEWKSASHSAILSAR